MQSKCPVCEIRVEEVEGLYSCPKCKASWKEAVWKKKRSLFKKRPSWLARNAKKVKIGLLISSALLPMVAATVLVMQASIIAG